MAVNKEETTNQRTVSRQYSTQFPSRCQQNIHGGQELQQTPFSRKQERRNKPRDVDAERLAHRHLKGIEYPVG